MSDQEKAFPSSTATMIFDRGMDLRDYFAAAQLSKSHGINSDEPDAYRRVAEHCYKMADAMLEARK